MEENYLYFGEDVSKAGRKYLDFLRHFSKAVLVALHNRIARWFIFKPTPPSMWYIMEAL
jgi:hypothetical protein